MPPDSSSGPQRYLIALGTSQYESDALPPLASVPEDLSRIDSLFVGRLGYRLADLGIKRVNSSEGAIRTAVGEWFASRDRSPDDIVAFYYSGHGDCYPAGGHYLCTPEFDPKNPAGPGALDTAKLATLFFVGDRHPQSILLLLDTCYSGQGAADVVDAVVKGLAQALPSNQGGVVVVTSARHHDPAYETIFTETFAGVVDEVARQYPTLPFIASSTIVDRINHHLREQKATHNAIGGCVDAFIPNPYTPGEAVTAGERAQLGGAGTATRRAAETAPTVLRDAQGLTTADELITFYTHVFVGRREELERLTSLVADAKPGYVHVRGPAGSGKSALIANVVHHFKRTPGDADGPVLLYYFIHDRLTDLRAVLQGLSAQLLVSLKAQEPLATDPQELHRQFGALWRRQLDAAGQRRPILLLIDGLDELTGTVAWLPATLADHVHVVVTSRPEFDLDALLPHEHLARFATRLPLRNLNEAELSELLAEHLNDRGRAQELAPEVARITRGLPLTAALLSREVAEQGVEALNRRHLSQALEDYLDEDAQRLTTAAHGLERRLIGILAVARGPLLGADLRRVLDVDESVLRGALNGIRRFLLSETSVEFLRPELRSAVVRHLGEGERASATRTLSDWLKSSVAESTHPIPAYVLTHFVAQMIEEDSDELLFRTVFGRRWREARVSGGAYLDYANDLTTLRDHAATPVARWPLFLEAGYLLARLRTVATSLRYSMFVLLAKLGDFATAEAHAELDSDISQKGWRFLELARFHQEVNDTDKAREALLRARRALEGVDPAERCALLSGLARQYRDLDDIATAKTLAVQCRDTISLVTDDWKRGEAIRDAVDALAAVGDFEGALDVASTDVEEYRRRALVAGIAAPFVTAGRSDLLLKALGDLPDDFWRKVAFADVVEALTARGHTEAALDIARASPDSDDALARMCRELARRGDFDRCIATFQDIGVERKDPEGDPPAWTMRYLQSFVRRWLGVPSSPPPLTYSVLAGLRRRRALKDILLYSPVDLDARATAGFAARLEPAVMLEHDADDVEALGDIVDWLVEHGAGNDAVALARRMKSAVGAIEGAAEQAKGRCYVSDALGAAGAWEEALEIVQPLLESDQETSPGGRDPARWCAAAALAHLDRVDDAQQVANAIESAETRALVTATIASVLSNVGRGEQAATLVADALECALGVPEARRTTVVTAIAYQYGEAGQARPAVAALRTIPAQADRDKALNVLAYLLALAGNIDGALESARAIADFSKRQDRFASLARILARRRNYEGALMSALQIEYVYGRARAVGECAQTILQNCDIYEREGWLPRLLRAARSLGDPDRLEALGRIGQAVLAWKDRQRALEIVTEAFATAHIVQGPGTKVYLGFARALAEIGEADKALAMLDRGRVAETESAGEAALLLARLAAWERAREIVDRLRGLPRLRTLAAGVEIAVATGQPDRARDWAELVEREAENLEPRERATARAHAARVFFVLGDRERSRVLAESAFADSGALDHDGLRELSISLARAGQGDLAARCLAGDEDRKWQELYQARVAEALAEAAQKDAALDLASRVFDSAAAPGADRFMVAWTRRHAVVALARAGRGDLALQKAQLLDNGSERTLALSEIARSFVTMNQPAEARSTVRKAFETINNVLLRNASLHVARASLAAILASIGDVAEAGRALQEAIRLGQAQGMDGFFDTLVAGVPVLTSLDAGATAWEVFEALEHAPNR